jgi:trehalose 6-phosphate phosphatase
MSLPFFECSSQRLDEIVQPGMLCAFDFDGTLAPIVTEPHRADVPLPVLRRLIELCEYTPVAVITGRALTDVCVRLDFAPNFVIGNHGLEGMPGWEGRAAQYERLCRQWEQSLQAALSDRAVFDPGIWIENKTYSLSVHYRLARNHAKAEAQLADLFASLTPPPHVIGGKCVYNLLPPGAANKGMALEQLLKESGAPSAIYIGDDVTDEDVFRLQRADLLSVRIGRDVDTKAEFFIHHRLDIVQFLDELIRRLRQARGNGETHGPATVLHGL